VATAVHRVREKKFCLPRKNTDQRVHIEDLMSYRSTYEMVLYLDGVVGQ
jgi:hypothetical protein